MGTHTCECGEEFSHQGGFKTHRKHCEESPVEPESYFCQCGEEFHTKGSLKSHQSSCSESGRKSRSWTYDKVECPDCGDMVAENQLERHRNSKTCEAGGKFETLRSEGKSRYIDKDYSSNATGILVLNWKVGDNEYECPECGKIYSKMGIGTHYWRNHTEEGQEFDPNSAYAEDRTAWNKGLTKKDHPSLKEAGEKISNLHENGYYEYNSLSESQKEEISRTVKEKVRNGNWHFSFSKVRTYNYKGHQLHGSWELEFAKWLDKKNISWERPTQKFEYSFEGGIKNYVPDFYLKEKDKFIEIKGYKTDKDEAKWRDFPHDLQILMEQDLKELDIIE